MLSAASFGYKEVVDELVRRKADLSSVNAHGLSLLQSTVLYENTNERILKAVLTHCPAAQEVNYQVPHPPGRLGEMYQARQDKARLAGGVGNVDRATRQFACGPGASALHMAAIAGLVPQVRLLLEAKADPSLRNGLGLTAAEVGCASGFPSILEAKDDGVAVRARGLR